MFRLLLLLALGACRYQFLSEQDAIETLTLSKEEVNGIVPNGNSPYYMITKQRHRCACSFSVMFRFNCISTYNYGNSVSGNKDLLKVSTYLLEKEVFSADTDVGSVTIYPTKRIEIRKDDSVSI